MTKCERCGQLKQLLDEFVRDGQQALEQYQRDLQFEAQHANDSMLVNVVESEHHEGKWWANFMAWAIRNGRVDPEELLMTLERFTTADEPHESHSHDATAHFIAPPNWTENKH